MFFLFIKEWTVYNYDFKCPEAPETGRKQGSIPSEAAGQHGLADGFIAAIQLPATSRRYLVVTALGNVYIFLWPQGQGYDEDGHKDLLARRLKGSRRRPGCPKYGLSEECTAAPPRPPAFWSPSSRMGAPCPSVG